MRTIRIMGPTAVLLLVGGMLAGNAQARTLGQNRDAQQQPNPGKGHDKGQGHDNGRGHDKGQGQSQQAQQQQHAQQQAQAQQAQQRILEQRQRDTQYRQALERQVQVTQQQAAQLQQQNRRAQIAAHQQYLANLRQQQQRLQATRDYSRDPAFSATPRYRYNRGGRSYETTQYGADMLRQAVNYGYQQGFQAGRADRQDGWRSGYRGNYAYQDANYGYDGRYVSQSDYNYYFREGFQRGYQDGYASSQRYGVISNGRPSILGSVLSAVLGLSNIR